MEFQLFWRSNVYVTLRKACLYWKVGLIVLAQIVHSFVQIKVKALGTEKSQLTRLSRLAPLSSFIIFYHDLELMATLLENVESW